MCWGYLGVQGKNKKEIIKTSVSIELIHMFLLIHDDVIDSDKFRHGVETIHSKYAKIGKIISKGKRDSVHFGNSIGIIMGDIVGALGNQILFTAKFPPNSVIEALNRLQSIVAMVAIGEAQDVFMDQRGAASEKEVLEMYENKTAKYTLEGPLHLGAILGGASNEILDKISKFAVPVGIAFQIQDDILGIFGDEKKVGKPVGSDIREGKQTILVINAMKQANCQQKKILNTLLGKKDLTKMEIKKFRNIIRETGALEYANVLAKKLIAKGKSNIEKIGFNKVVKKRLLALADYMAQREV
jgi:geranylgeranyl diphosphate synthase type I